MNVPDPADLEATVQAALGARCSVGIDFVDIDEVARSMTAAPGTAPLRARQP